MTKSKLRIFNFLFIGLALVHLTLLVIPGCEISASISKALPILLIAVFVAGFGDNRFAVAALTFSIFGDVFAEFMFLGNFRMPLQIIFFCLAHTFYIMEFLHFNPKCRLASTERMNSILPFMMGFYGLLEVGTLVAASLQKRRHKRIFVLGSVIFLISDATILVRTVTAGFMMDDFLVMLTYFIAQYLMNIALLLPERK